MKTDFQSASREGPISIVRAASMAADRRAARGAPEMPSTPVPRRGRSILLFLTAILLLIGLGGAALYAVYYLKTTKPAATAPAIGIIFAEQQTALPIDGQQTAALKQAIARVMASAGAAGGSIAEIIPTTIDESTGQARRATVGEFIRALGGRPPDDLVRSLSDDFFFGIHYADTPSPVFVIPVTSYDHAFADMLTWEKTINTDLSGLFVQLPAYKASAAAALMASTTAPAATSTNAIATSTAAASTTPPASGVPGPTMQELSPPRTFEDLVMRNYDVRALKDDNGTIVLYYSFPTQDILIISASPYTFPEVLSRLQAARKL